MNFQKLMAKKKKKEEKAWKVERLGSKKPEKSMNFYHQAIKSGHSIEPLEEAAASSWEMHARRTIYFTKTSRRSAKK